MKNRNNAKNFRIRKKQEKQTVEKQILTLEQENKYLKMQKYCRHCRRAFDPHLSLETVCETEKEHGNKSINMAANEKDGF
jgi:hypothetical protein